MLNFRVATILLVAELLLCTSNVECDANFTECYNTTTEMHCFSKIVNGPLNFTEAQKRCSAIDTTLPVIKNEEVQMLLETFISHLSNPAGIEDTISYFWTNANRIVETSWQWLNFSVISELSVNITTGAFLENHVASLALQNSTQQEVILTANNPADTKSYICEFFGSDCKSQNGNVLQYSDRCYVASKETATWYDARNICLKEHGDLASFGDLKSTNINFTQWLDLSNGKQYWVGVRLLRWLWNKSDNMSEVRYTSWFHRYPPYSSYECVSVLRNSGTAAEINRWGTTDCNQDQSVGAICHKVMALPKDEGSVITLKDSTTASSVIPLAVGIGLGVGIPVVIAIIVIIVVCVKRKRKPHQNGDTLAKNTDDSVLHDAQTDSMETGKDDNAATGGVYWNVAKNDSASATKDVGKVIESSASNTNNGDGTVYSAVQLVEEQYEEDML